MIHAPRAARRVAPRAARRVDVRAGLVLGALLVHAGAGAMTTSYQCIGYRTLTAEFTPREAQVHFEGKNWTLARVRDASEATYVNGHEGVRVVTRQRELTLHTAKETLSCKLQSDAVKAAEGEAGKRPASAPSAAH
jgi:hypothetical protein